MFEQSITDAIRALMIYAVGIIVFLPFNFFVSRKKFQFTKEECMILSVLWPLCIIGLVLSTIGAVYRFFGRIFHTRKQDTIQEMMQCPMTLTATDLERVIRTAMHEGCIRQPHVFDAVDEALHRLSKIEELVKSIDLTECSPLPWKSQLHSYPIADTGEYDGSCDATDAKGESIVAKFDDNYREVEMEDGDYDADILAICGSVNAVKTIKDILKS